MDRYSSNRLWYRNDFSYGSIAYSIDLVIWREKMMTQDFKFNVDRFGIVPWNKDVCGWEERMVHGSPQDRGSADRYYGRPYEPHWYPNGTGKAPRISEELMTTDQIAEYAYGYENEDDRKDWG